MGGNHLRRQRLKISSSRGCFGCRHGCAASAGHLAVARDELTRERRRMKEHAWKYILAARADAGDET